MTIYSLGYFYPKNGLFEFQVKQPIDDGSFLPICLFIAPALYTSYVQVH